MTAEGYVLISVESGLEKEVHSDLRKIHDIVELNRVGGAWDFIVKICAHNAESLVHTVVSRIRKLHGVLDTLLLLVMEPDMLRGAVPKREMR